MPLSGSPLYLDHATTPYETLEMDSERNRTRILGPHHLPRKQEQTCSCSDLGYKGGLDLGEGKQCHRSRQRLKRYLVSLLLWANLAPRLANKAEWVLCNFITAVFLLWLAQCRSDVSSIQLHTQSPRAACQREANYIAWLPRHLTSTSFISGRLSI